jgi:hypothetical protein
VIRSAAAVPCPANTVPATVFCAREYLEQCDRVGALYVLSKACFYFTSVGGLFLLLWLVLLLFVLFANARDDDVVSDAELTYNWS